MKKIFLIVQVVVFGTQIYIHVLKLYKFLMTSRECFDAASVGLERTCICAKSHASAVGGGSASLIAV